MISSMTQRPLSFGEHQDLTPGPCRVKFPGRVAGFNATDLGSAGFNSGDMSRLKTHSFAQINAVKNWDRPPTYLETALRCLVSWQWRIATQCSLPAHTTSSVQLAQMSHAVDLQSFDMLFWLGVMWDTTSSTLTQRPLVISDNLFWYLIRVRCRRHKWSKYYF